MKFFFAENCDTVDPDFDFIKDLPREGRNRTNDLYPHELLSTPPYDGILVSRAVVEGISGSKRYTLAQKFHFLRVGVHQYFRYPEIGFSGNLFEFPVMGDCGSFSYVKERIPPFNAEDTFDFYKTAGVQYGVAPDHIILDHNPSWDKRHMRPEFVEERIRFTRSSAKRFLELSDSHSGDFTPIGPIQCWSPSSAAKEAKYLVNIGYQYLGLGGLVTRNTQQIYDLVGEIRSSIPNNIKLHLFGFSRIDELERFMNLGIHSFDSTSPMLKSFKDDENGYFSKKGKHYVALRVPSSDDKKLKSRVKSGHLDSEKASDLGSSALDAIRSFDRGEIDIKTAVSEVHTYDSYVNPGKDMRKAYERTLDDAPWRECPCAICRSIGVEVIIHRNLNRHKRRGMHNLYVFHEKLKRIRKMKTIKLPCLRIQQSKGRHIYSFAVQGKDIQKFATVSRVSRSEEGELLGYQRPEISTHINDIRDYLDSPESILPNAIIIAFDKKLKFEAYSEPDGDVAFGNVEIPLGTEKKPGWVIDGQQRLAALRKMKRRIITVPVTAIESNGLDDEREQFVLVNNARPLPKSLVYELLPSLGDAAPPKYRRRQAAVEVSEILSADPESPFHQRIRNTTSNHLSTANIKDVSVLRMIENSVDNGILARYPKSPKPQAKVLIQFWSAVAKVFPEAWDLPPKHSRLTHGVGIIGMGFLMDAIAFRLKQREKALNVHNFRNEIMSIRCDFAWTDGRWNLAPDVSIPWKEIQNTNRHIDLIANHLIRAYRVNVTVS